MSTAELDPISRACCLLREGAAELKNCHTLASTGHDWTGEPEAKAAYDEHMATADALERVHAECETLRTGYAAARLHVFAHTATLMDFARAIERAHGITTTGRKDAP